MKHANAGIRKLFFTLQPYNVHEDLSPIFPLRDMRVRSVRAPVKARRARLSGSWWQADVGCPGYVTHPVRMAFKDLLLHPSLVVFHKQSVRQCLMHIQTMAHLKPQILTRLSQPALAKRLTVGSGAAPCPGTAIHLQCLAERYSKLAHSVRQE